MTEVEALQKENEQLIKELHHYKTLYEKTWKRYQDLAIDFDRLRTLFWRMRFRHHKVLRKSKNESDPPPIPDRSHP